VGRQKKKKSAKFFDYARKRSQRSTVYWLGKILFARNVNKNIKANKIK
jgi:hypothetical protein